MHLNGASPAPTVVHSSGVLESHNAHVLHNPAVSMAHMVQPGVMIGLSAMQSHASAMESNAHHHRGVGQTVLAHEKPKDSVGPILKPLSPPHGHWVTTEAVDGSLIGHDSGSTRAVWGKRAASEAIIATAKAASFVRTEKSDGLITAKLLEHAAAAQSLKPQPPPVMMMSTATTAVVLAAQPGASGLQPGQMAYADMDARNNDEHDPLKQPDPKKARRDHCQHGKTKRECKQCGGLLK